MKVLENYTIKHVKEMSNEELFELWSKICEEKRAMDIRHTIVNMFDVIEANKPRLEV